MHGSKLPLDLSKVVFEVTDAPIDLAKCTMNGVTVDKDMFVKEERYTGGPGSIPGDLGKNHTKA